MGPMSAFISHLVCDNEAIFSWDMDVFVNGIRTKLRPPSYKWYKKGSVSRVQNFITAYTIISEQWNVERKFPSLNIFPMEKFDLYIFPHSIYIIYLDEIYLSIYVSIFLYIYIYDIYLSIYLSIYVSFYLSI